ncbi:MAG: hypothetical protein E7178_05180 [Erysipelotrichaceae bacterium]|jgi:hypothetical protein|nr:hypothetical protein [Erysipelotrichaceae bacterium]
MPPVVKQVGLTKSEKQVIIKRHHELVDKMNEKLPDELKLQYDDNGLKEKFADPSEVVAYRASLGINAKKMMQDATLQQLKAKHPSNFENYGFKIERYFRTDNTKEAREFNEKLYTNYIADPDAFMNMAFSSLVCFNPMEIYECEDDKGKLAEYYYNHFEECENAMALSNYLSNNPNIAESIKAKKTSILAITNALKYPVEMCKNITNADYLACPELSKEQAEKFNLNDQLEFTDIVNQKIKDAVDGGDIAPTEYYDSLGIGEIIEEGNYYALALEIEFTKSVQVGDTTSTTAVSPSEFINNKGHEAAGVEYEVVHHPRGNLNDHEFALDAVSTVSQEKFFEEFGSRLNEKLGISGSYSAKKIEDKYKGNIFERLGGTTSEQYKALRDAIKDFSDPNSPHFMNYSYMKEKAEAYIAHKEDQGYLTAGYLYEPVSTSMEANGGVPMTDEEIYRHMVAAERHQELQLFAEGKKAKELTGTEFKRFCLAKSIIDMGKEIQEVYNETIGQSIYQLGGVNRPVEYTDFFSLYDQEPEEPDNVIEEELANNANKKEKNKVKDDAELSIEDDEESMKL